MSKSNTTADAIRIAGLTSFEFLGDQVAEMTSPMVYAWVRDGLILYVGQTARGMARPLDAAHAALRHIRHHDKLLIWLCDNYSAAERLEARLIKALSPDFNSTNRYRWATETFLRAKEERASLLKRLEMLERIIANSGAEISREESA